MFTSMPLFPNDVNPSRELSQIYRFQVRLIVGASVISAIGLYIWVLIATLPLSKPDEQTSILFTGLMLIHLCLHGLCIYIKRRQRLAIIYLLVQTSLLYFAGSIIHYPLSAVFLTTLLAEIIIIFDALWLIPIVVVVTLVLQVVSTFAMFSAPGVPSSVILSTIFQSLLVNFFGYIPVMGTLFLVVRARRQTGALLLRLDIAHRQLAVYAEQVEQLTVTAERARMARELHDTLAQGVTGLIMQLEALDSQMERADYARVATTLTLIKSRARATLKESRSAIDDLRLMPEQLSMILSSIASEANQFSTLTGIPCTVDAPPSLTLPTSTTEHTLRFISEGLANIAKHAVASKVSIRVKVQDNAVLLEIQDNGVGFDPMAAAQNHGHYGLLGLQERARLVGGKFEVDSTPHQGTTLRLYLPKQN
jgi:NarL family two-component system sensor histidine kinase YdfH